MLIGVSGNPAHAADTLHRSQVTMGIWIELGIFLVVIAFGFWQLHDVKKAQAERRAREQVATPPEPAGKSKPKAAKGS
jgi:cytochrome oxidase assembly protein ShyY1